MAMNTNHKMKFCDGRNVKTVVIYIKKTTMATLINIYSKSHI